MGNDNLRSLGTLTMEERREIAKKAGIASGKKRRQLKAWKDITRAVLAMPIKNGKLDKNIKSIADAKGKNIRVQDVLVIAQVMQAMKGNPKAFEMLLSLSGLMDDSTETGNPFDGVTTEDLKKLVDNDG
jgi:hypothetical protein|nr:MAG TPA: hypothetical protein [Caudoviricetes sp.]